MSNPLSPTGEFPAFNPTARQVLPITAGVRPVKFSTRNFEISSQVRDVLDSFERSPFLPAPRPAADDAMAESIVMEGSQISRAWRKTGAYEVRQVTTGPLEVVTEPAPLAFEAVDTSMQTAASEALATMANRRPHARRGHRLPAKRLQTPRTASPVWLAAVIVIGALTAAVLLSGVLVNR